MLKSTTFLSPATSTSWYAIILYDRSAAADFDSSYAFSVKLVSFELEQNNRLCFIKVSCKSEIFERNFCNKNNDFVEYLNGRTYDRKTAEPAPGYVIGISSFDRKKTESIYINNKLLLDFDIELKALQSETVLKRVPVRNGSLIKLLESGDFSDVEIKIGNRVYELHRNILAARCAYFEAMFTHSFKEAEEPVVPIEGVDPNMFWKLLMYLYSETIPEDLAMYADELRVVADRFGVTELVEACDKIKRQ